MRAIIKRELYSYFCSPLAYVIMAIFLFFAGLFFTLICLSNSNSKLTYVFTNMFLVTTFLTPMLCMRLMSDEKRLKTDQALLQEGSDRMGIRLSGEKIESVSGTDILSDGTVFGSVQITSSGQPIVLMADRQTTGGYAKIATVLSADLPKLAQMKPGDTVRFVRASV